MSQELSRIELARMKQLAEQAPPAPSRLPLGEEPILTVVEGGQQTSGTLTIEEIVEKTTDLPTMPAAALAVMREAGSSTCTARTVAAHISQDQALAARVLRLSNSAFYGLVRQVSDVQEAVVVLGMRAVRNLAVVAATYPWMSKSIKGYGLGPKEMWAHSFGVAVSSQLLASRTGVADGDEAFTAGLLHNIGKVALSVWLENRSAAIARLAERENLSFDRIEKEVLGFDHAEVGAFLAERWKLPRGLTDVIRYHHSPDDSEPPNPITDLVHVGDYLTLSMGIGLGNDGLNYGLSENSLARLGLGVADLEDALCAFVDQYRRYDRMFEGLHD